MANDYCDSDTYAREAEFVFVEAIAGATGHSHQRRRKTAGDARDAFIVAKAQLHIDVVARATRLLAGTKVGASWTRSWARLQTYITPWSCMPRMRLCRGGSGPAAANR